MSAQFSLPVILCRVREAHSEMTRDPGVQSAALVTLDPDLRRDDVNLNARAL